MREFLFDVSWWAPVLMSLIGIVLLLVGNSRQINVLRTTGAVVALLAIVWTALTFVVETPRKLCEKLTRQAVQSVADGDWKTFDDLLAPNVDARYVGRNWRVDGRPVVAETAKMVAKNSGLQSAGVAGVHSREHDSLITVAFTASTDTELTPGHPIDSDWEFDFRKDQDQWRIAAIRVSRVDDTEPEGIRQSLNKH